MFCHAFIQWGCNTQNDTKQFNALENKKKRLNLNENERFSSQRFCNFTFSQCSSMWFTSLMRIFQRGLSKTSLTALKWPSLRWSKEPPIYWVHLWGWRLCFLVKMSRKGNWHFVALCATWTDERKCLNHCDYTNLIVDIQEGRSSFIIKWWLSRPKLNRGRVTSWTRGKVRQKGRHHSYRDKTPSFALVPRLSGVIVVH